MRLVLTCVVAVLLAAAATAAEPAGPQPLPKDAPRLAHDVTVVLEGSSVTMNRYGCLELPAWTGGDGRVPPQANGQNVFFRVFEMLNDHENMCWRRLTDQDWKRQGEWKPETRLSYNDVCYGKRVSYAGTAPEDFAELSVPAGYEKLDLIFTSDPKGDKIRVTIDGQPPAENALVDTRQETKIPPNADLGKDIDTLDSHGEPRKLQRPTAGISNIVELRARYKLDPAKAHLFRAQRAGAEADKRILVWGAVYWRGNCAQVIQRAKGGINCGDLPNYHAIQETVALKPDYLLMEAINIRGKPEQVTQTLDPGLAWCAAHSAQFKTMVYATAQANCKAFRAAFKDKVTDDVAGACAGAVVEMCRKYKLPMVDNGPPVDAWLTANPKGRFIGHIYADWYHPNQFGAAIFAQTIAEGIRKNWPELPVRPINMPGL